MEFNQLPSGEVFATGILPNSAAGLFMTDSGGELRWIAQKGYGYDWAIYSHWASHNIEWIKKYGDKVMSEKHIKLCVLCEDEVFKLYRY